MLKVIAGIIGVILATVLALALIAGMFWLFAFLGSVVYGAYGVGGIAGFCLFGLMISGVSKAKVSN